MINNLNKQVGTARHNYIFLKPISNYRLIHSSRSQINWQNFNHLDRSMERNTEAEDEEYCGLINVDVGQWSVPRNKSEKDDAKDGDGVFWKYLLVFSAISKAMSILSARSVNVLDKKSLSWGRVVIWVQTSMHLQALNLLKESSRMSSMAWRSPTILWLVQD